jgi:hypothetical protein
MIADWSDEYLCLVLQPSEGVRMDDPITITLELGSQGIKALGGQASLGLYT